MVRRRRTLEGLSHVVALSGAALWGGCGGSPSAEVALPPAASGVALYTFAPPDTEAPPPASWLRAVAVHEAAVRAFEAGDALSAAAGFAEAAALVRAPWQGPPTATAAVVEALAGARAAACRNAALALDAAGRPVWRPDAAGNLVEAAPACEGTLRGLTDP